MTPRDASRAARPARARIARTAQPAAGRPAATPVVRAWHAVRDACRSFAHAVNHWRLHAFPRLDERALIVLVREPQFAPHLLATLSYAHEHQVKEGLLNRQTATGHRVTALVAMQTMHVRAASPILHALLNDPADA